MERVEERFAEKIVIEDDCWIWQAHISHKGYAIFGVAGRTVRAHRWAYEYMIGEIPEGLVLDHLCDTPSCVNPFHCRPTTHKRNILRGTGIPAVNARKTHCIHGHPLSGENLYIHKRGRKCRTCMRTFQKAYYRRNK